MSTLGVQSPLDNRYKASHRNWKSVVSPISIKFSGVLCLRWCWPSYIYPVVLDKHTPLTPLPPPQTSL